MRVEVSSYISNKVTAAAHTPPMMLSREFSENFQDSCSSEHRWTTGSLKLEKPNMVDNQNDDREYEALFYGY